MKKKFDAQTAKKIINEYAEQINLLSRENKVLKKQLEDSNISLQINKEILYSHIKSKKNVSEECESIITDLKKENERLNDKIAWLFTEKGELAKNLYKLQDSLNDKLNQENNLIEKERTEKFIYENKLKEKEFQIENLKKQIENLKKNSKNANNAVKEIYIGDPNKFNVEINNELTMSRYIIKKYVYLNQQERDNSRLLQDKIHNLENKVSSISTNTSFIINANNQQLNLLNEIFQENNINSIENNNISLSSDDSDDDEDNIDLSFIKNHNLKESKRKRTKTCEKVSKIPKLDFKSVVQNYKNPPNIKVIGDNEENKTNDNNIDENGSKLLNQKYKSQIDIYKKTIANYKEKINKLRKQIRNLIDKNSFLFNTLKMYMNSKGNNDIKQVKKDDVSMNPNINDASGLSSNSIIFKGGTLENINKLSEINKITRLNQISTNINNNIKKEDPLDNIIIKDDHYKATSKETDKITTNGSSKN
jgi:chaperonin cofactor prefoldin